MCDQEGANQRSIQNEAPDATQSTEERIQFREVSLAIEFMCWVVVALAPVLRLVNGAPVTDDQAVIQIALVVLATTSAVSLRIYNWRVPLPKKQEQQAE